MSIQQSLDNIKETDAAARDPQVGDRYHEMLSYWLHVVRVESDRVWTLEAGAPCDFLKVARLVEHTRQSFRKYLCYNSAQPGYWVRLFCRGENVVGWYEHVLARQVECEKSRVR